MTDTLHTSSGYRAQLMASDPGKPLNWLFFPGGPGLGSESLSDLGEKLKLPGKTWYIDYPNDGSNQISKNTDFNSWADSITELLSAFSNIIIVAHSFGGMFILSNKHVKESIKGLILMDTSPNREWLDCIKKDIDKIHLEDMQKATGTFINDPNDETFKNYTMTRAHYFFTESSLEKGKSLLETLPFCYSTYDWALKEFHPHYAAAFIPDTIPVLVFAGEYDKITPLSLFINNNQWQRDNITVKEIQHAGHFPWLDNFTDVKAAFHDYINSIE